MRDMPIHLKTKLEIKSFDEKPYRELSAGRKYTRTDIVMSVSDEDFEAEVTWDALSFYAADGTATSVSTQECYPFMSLALNYEVS